VKNQEAVGHSSFQGFGNRHKTSRAILDPDGPKVNEGCFQRRWDARTSTDVRRGHELTAVAPFPSRAGQQAITFHVFATGSVLSHEGTPWLGTPSGRRLTAPLVTSRNRQSLPSCVWGVGLRESLVPTGSQLAEGWWSRLLSGAHLSVRRGMSRIPHALVWHMDWEPSPFRPHAQRGVLVARHR
jgi:hypothetical protein